MKKLKYSKKPSAEPSAVSRLDVVMRVQRGELTMTAGAAELGLSREYFHDLYNRSIEAMLTELTPKSGGRPRKDETQSQQDEELTRLRKENEALQRRMSIQQEALGALVDLVKSQPARRREPRSSKSSTTTTNDTASEDDRASRLELTVSLCSRGLPQEQAAWCAGISRTTFLRWRSRRAMDAALVQQRGGRVACAPPAMAVACAEQRVRVTHGLIGAEGLARSSGLSRRHAARVKAATCTAMERERKEAASRVAYTSPGVVRGFDAMYLSTLAGWRFALIGGDAAIPFRTSALFVDSYTSENVARALDEDFTRRGAPLVLRLDRHSTHRTDEVNEVLAKHQVLALHGPAHHPQFYGQLERQNRDHRAWLDTEVIDPACGQDQLDEMCRCWNELIPCRRLQWCTPSEVWEQRPVLDVDRSAFADEVRRLSAAIANSLDERALQQGDDRRLGIQQALQLRGLLTINSEARC